jgi:hypothetical protein
MVEGWVCEIYEIGIKNKLCLQKGKRTGKLPKIAFSLQTQSNILISETNEEDHMEILGTLHFKYDGIRSVSMNSKYSTYDKQKQRS